MSSNIAHVAVYASDREKTKDFYAHFFGGKCGALYRNNRGFTSYFISFKNGARLEVMHSENMKCRKPAELESGWSHVAFSVGSKDDVVSLTQKIVSAGYPLYSAPRETGDGYYESCVGDPDGNRIEITV